MASDSKVIVGKVGRSFGVKGEVKLHSFTDPDTQIFNYQPLQINVAGKWQSLKLDSGCKRGSNLIAKFNGWESPEQVKQYANAQIAIERKQLPNIDNTDEIYWADLEGMTVINTQGKTLGNIDYLFETPANNVIVIKGEQKHLLPYILEEVVLKVDVAHNTMLVNWDPDF